MRADPRHVARARNVGRRWLIALVVVGLACIGLMLLWVLAWLESEGFAESVAVENQTASDLTLEAQTVDGQWLEVGTVAALDRGGFSAWDWFGTSSLTGVDGCSLGAVRARDASEREVARHPGPLCADDTWVIVADP